MLSNFPHLNRRHFLKHMAGSAAMAAGGMQFVQQLTAAAPSMKKQGKSIIVLWMGGGPTHIDLWSVGDHVGHANQGSFEPIKTTADGIEISESMPKVAAQFKHMSVFRALYSDEGDHNRGTTRMNTGFPPSTIGVQIPHVGSIVSHYVGDKDQPLQFISVGGTATRIGSGFLGNALAPFTVQNPGTVPENIKMPQLGDEKQSSARGLRRKDLLTTLENNFKFGITPHMTKEADRKAFGDAAQAHSELVQKALDISLRAGSKLFEFDAKDTKSLERYGNNGFGRGCLLAKKLVENGVSAVEVDLGGWDMHGNIADGVRRNATGTLDPGMGSLIQDLADSGKLKDTLIVWMGDFGRTPRINQGAGRDHWPGGWDIVLGGAGIKPGVEYGKMEVGGMAAKSGRINVNQLYATMYSALGIDLGNRDLDLHDNIGRRFYIAGEKENAKPISEMLSKA